MNVTRREVILSSLFGAGYVGLRALATGLPAAVLLNPRHWLAEACRLLAAIQSSTTTPKRAILSSDSAGALPVRTYARMCSSLAFTLGLSALSLPTLP